MSNLTFGSVSERNVELMNYALSYLKENFPDFRFSAEAIAELQAEINVIEDAEISAKLSKRTNINEKDYMLARRLSNRPI